MPRHAGRTAGWYDLERTQLRLSEFSMHLPKLGSTVLLIFACSFIPMLVAAATDPLSGLPLFPGASVSVAPQSQQLCGITMRSVQYVVSGATAKPVDFFHRALPGASTWSIANGYVTAFLTPNGQAIVKVLSGAPHSYTIVYGSYSKPVTVSQVRTGVC
ncbi:MAG TPA: hypothetical protein VNF68_07680 [Candidatus Baltobacteraceae bacterium]|nr:hypothetical protein [Candidatus Baltobacteraceae bacterium]